MYSLLSYITHLVNPLDQRNSCLCRYCRTVAQLYYQSDYKRVSPTYESKSFKVILIIVLFIDKSSSVPSKAFVIPHFLKLRRMMSGVIDDHDSVFHFNTSFLLGAFLLPYDVFPIGPLNSHSSYSSTNLFLNGLFQDTSACCTFEVHPPGINT